MSKKPYANDWVTVYEGLQYSETRKLYWYRGRVYDHRSAAHNGLIGAGYVLKEVIKHENQ